MRNTVVYYHGYDYQLRQDAWFNTSVVGYNIDTEYATLSVNGKLKVKKNFGSDGATGIWDTKHVIPGSMVHDALYMLLRMGLLPRSERDNADRTLEAVCIESGMWKWYAKIIYLGVKFFAAAAAHPDHRRKEYTAP